jgi:hypothetical protein
MKKKLLIYGSMIIAGILWQTDILEGDFNFYTILRILGFIAIFVAYEVWIQVLLPMWEEWEKNDKQTWLIQSNCCEGPEGTHIFSLN